MTVNVFSENPCIDLEGSCWPITEEYGKLSRLKGACLPRSHGASLVLIHHIHIYYIQFNLEPITDSSRSKDRLTVHWVCPFANLYRIPTLIWCGIIRKDFQIAKLNINQEVHVDFCCCKCFRCQCFIYPYPSQIFSGTGEPPRRAIAKVEQQIFMRPPGWDVASGHGARSDMMWMFKSILPSWHARMMGVTQNALRLVNHHFIDMQWQNPVWRHTLPIYIYKYVQYWPQTLSTDMMTCSTYQSPCKNPAGFHVIIFQNVHLGSSVPGLISAKSYKPKHDFLLKKAIVDLLHTRTLLRE